MWCYVVGWVVANNLKDRGVFASSGLSLLLLTDPEYEGVKVLKSFKTSGNAGSMTLCYIPKGLSLKILMYLFCWSCCHSKFVYCDWYLLALPKWLNLCGQLSNHHSVCRSSLVLYWWICSGSMLYIILHCLKVLSIIFYLWNKMFWFLDTT